MTSHPNSLMIRSPRMSMRHGPLSPPGSASSALSPRGPRYSAQSPRSPAVSSIRAHPASHPSRAPASPYPHLPNRTLDSPHQHAVTMPHAGLPDALGLPAGRPLPAHIGHQLPHTYHSHLPHSLSQSPAASISSPLAQRFVAAPTPRSVKGFARPVPVNHEMHDDAARRHHLSGNFGKFFFSSYEYVQNPYYPVHPAFADWIHTLGPEALAFIWREVPGNILLPVVYMYQYKSKANVENYNVGARLEYLHLSHDGQSFSKEYMGDICIREQWHLVHKNKPLLMFAQPLNPRLIPARGQMFAPKGTDKRFPSRAKPNVQVLTHSFRADKVDQSRWEVTRDGCLCIAEKHGDGPNVGIITSEPSVHGWIISGPVVWEAESKTPELWKNGFLTHVIMGLIVIPMERPSNMTRLLTWLRKLGELASEE